MTDFGSLVRCFFAILMAVATHGVSQDSSDESSEASPVMVRGWLFPSGDTQAVSFTLKSAGEEKVIALASTKDGAVASARTYADILQAGSFVAELKAGEDVLASESIALGEGRHYTLVGWSENGRWQIKAFADSPASSNAPDRPLRVLNFAAGRKTAVALSGAPESMVAGDSVQELRSPAAVTMVSVKVLASDGGPPAQSSVEIDFSGLPCAYVVVGPDYRGRMRPRVIEGGAPPPEFPAPTAAPGSQQ